ncbi:hypothetical protein [Actinoplanes utahensis]|uniref:Uncharacterized protein n=1 Tax=Actinoplanes utahensis TaxID=1869 RepID=A0A0A6UIU0_ACTUT|nr:hypothetical protein [Actinoplanes utahensis]KHD75331.1 hypothetical protein MB27_23055 [Actinoplanes utahensis]GIF33781.1 hypothetical protein Aut01nite_67670 [Actinoplanes utahensis]
MPRRLGPAALLICLLTLPGCTGGGEGEDRTLPSTRPSAERTTEKTPERTTERTTESTPEKTTEKPPERTPERTTESTPQKTTEKPPERTTQPAPAKTTTTQTPEKTSVTRVEVTVTVQASKTTATPSPSAAVPVSAADEDDTGGWLGWILLFLLFGGLAAAVLVSRSRRTANWETRQATLTAQTRTVIEGRLPSVLTARGDTERAVNWPPVRADLTGLVVSWGELAGETSDPARQALATGVAALLRDLVEAVDVENQAVAAGYDWRPLRPAVEEILDSLDATLSPPVMAGPQGPPSPPPGPWDAPGPQGRPGAQGRPGPESPQSPPGAPGRPRPPAPDDPDTPGYAG